MSTKAGQLQFVAAQAIEKSLTRETRVRVSFIAAQAIEKTEAIGCALAGLCRRSVNTTILTESENGP